MFFLEKIIHKNNISVVPTMKDQIKKNALCCVTFKLIWDDFQYNISENNFTYKKRNELFNNLIDSGKIENNILSEDCYYKVAGKITIALKEKI